MIPNKVWEIIEKEGSHQGSGMDGFRKGRTGMQGFRRDTMYRKSDEQEMQKVYECGFEDGYTEAMKKIFHIIRDSE